MNTKTEKQIADIKSQTIGVEIEMNNITRMNAAKLAAEYFGTHRYADTARDILTRNLSGDAAFRYGRAA